MNESNESIIKEFQSFHNNYISSITNKAKARRDFAKLYSDFKSFYDEKKEEFSIFDEDYLRLKSKGRALFEHYIGDEGVQLYSKNVKHDKKANKNIEFTENILMNILIAFTEGVSKIEDKQKRQFKYKMDLLKLCYLCLRHNGLHPLIYKREDSHKKYNLLITFHRKHKEHSRLKIMLNWDGLVQTLLKPFHHEVKIILNGTVIKPEDILEVKITTTKLNRDEIGLFAEKKGFLWNEEKQDLYSFLHACQDETDDLILSRNIHSLAEAEVIYKNRLPNYVNLKRIDELEKISCDEFDLAKLIELCKELNQNADNENWFSVLYTLRAIIDHVPPIFGYKRFNQAVSNYKWDKSVKKSLQTLQESSRNISDHSIHSGVKRKDAIPNQTQTDFSNSLDVLLCEVIRALK